MTKYIYTTFLSSVAILLSSPTYASLEDSVNEEKRRAVQRPNLPTGHLAIKEVIEAMADYYMQESNNLDRSMALTMAEKRYEFLKMISPRDKKHQWRPFPKRKIPLQNDEEAGRD